MPASLSSSRRRRKHQHVFQSCVCGGIRELSSRGSPDRPCRPRGARARARRTPYYARELATVVRTALRLGDRPLSERLVDALEPRYPLDEHALCASRAQLAEHAGELEEAAALYAEAAGRWLEFGHVPERAYALLGQGRCLRALGRPGAEEPLLEARELFASMGYVPALGEVDGLLGSAETAARKRQPGGGERALDVGARGR